MSAPCGPYIGEFDPKNAYRKPLVILKTVLNARFDCSLEKIKPYSREPKTKIDQWRDRKGGAEILMRLSEQYLAFASLYNNRSET